MIGYWSQWNGDYSADAAAALGIVPVKESKGHRQ